MTPFTPRHWPALVLFTVAVSAAVANQQAVIQVAQGKDSATVRMVMQKAMKGGLARKVSLGQASNEERAELLILFSTLAACDPPKGDKKSWIEKTGALVSAVSTRDLAALKAACNCAACHKEHK